MSRSFLFMTLISSLWTVIDVSPLQAAEPTIVIEVESGSFSALPVGALGSSTNELSIKSINHFIDGRKIGVSLTGINQPKGQHRIAYVILVKHNFKDLEESAGFPCRQKNDGKNVWVTQEIMQNNRKLSVKYTAEWKPDGSVQEEFQSGDKKFDLKSGRIFMADLTSPSSELTQASQDLGNNFVFPKLATVAFVENFVKTILTNASKSKAVQTFMETGKPAGD